MDIILKCDVFMYCLHPKPSKRKRKKYKERGMLLTVPPTVRSGV